MSSLSLTLLGAAREAAEAHIPGLIDHEFASRLAAKDHTLWGIAAEDEASKRLGWVSPFGASRPLLERIEALRAELAAEGVDRVVLAGMGGSSLAPEVICASAGVPLVVLDSTDPQQVASALTDLQRSVLVVASKSGSTVETDSQRRVVQEAFSQAGIDAQARTELADICLTGGSMGGLTIGALLAEPAWAAADPRRVQVWWGDERWLPRGARGAVRRTP